MIVNGHRGDWEERFPYLVGVSTPYTNCTGFFVEKNTVVTAASCFDSPATKDPAYVSKVKVFWFGFGASDNSQSPFKPSSGSGYPPIGVKNVIVHPLFNPKNFEYDVAVLFLEQCVGSGYILKSPWEAKYSTDHSFDYEQASTLIVPGWGQDSTDGERTDDLRFGFVDYTPHSTSCKPNEDGLQLCAAASSPTFDNRTQDACIGDSGSPLIYNFDAAGFGNPDANFAGSKFMGDRVVGILSGGRACGRKIDASGNLVANLYTNTTMIWGWLTLMTGSSRYCRDRYSPDYQDPVDPYVFSCFNVLVNLEPDNPLGDCQYTLIRKDRIIKVNRGSKVQPVVTWARKSAKDGPAAPPEVTVIDELPLYRFTAGQAYGYVASTSDGPACSGVVRVFPCTPRCKDITKVVDAREGPKCTGRVQIGFSSPSDFWDLETVAYGANRTIVHRGGAGARALGPDEALEFTIGTYRLSGEVYYSDMKSNRSSECTVRVTDATVMDTPSAAAGDGAVCFYRKGRGTVVAVPLGALARLPEGPRCGERLDGRKVQRLVATSCVGLGSGAAGGGGNKDALGSSRGSVCQPSTPAATQDDFAPLGAIVVDVRAARSVQRMRATIQTWNPDGPVGGGLEGPAPTLSMNFTFYKSPALGKRKGCQPVSTSWSTQSSDGADVDECRFENGGCSRAAACNMTGAGVKCTCNPGFEGNGRSCADINECRSKVVVCGGPNEYCVNIEGSYRCNCKDGYERVGEVCKDVDECRANGTLCGGAACVNKEGGYSCSCPAGMIFTGTGCAGSCTMILEHRSAASTMAISLDEIHLFAPDGAQIPPRLLRYSMSSTSDGGDYSVDNCFDGNTDHSDSWVGCQSMDAFTGDPRPTITVEFPCTGGGPGQVLSEIVVHNSKTCCQARITDFRIRVLAPTGGVVATYQFNIADTTYYINLPPANGCDRSTHDEMDGVCLWLCSQYYYRNGATQACDFDCTGLQRQFGIMPGRGWGSLDPDQIGFRHTWNQSLCDSKLCRAFKAKYGATSGSSLGSMPDVLKPSWSYERPVEIGGPATCDDMADQQFLPAVGGEWSTGLNDYGLHCPRGSYITAIGALLGNGVNAIGPVNCSDGSTINLTYGNTDGGAPVWDASPQGYIGVSLRSYSLINQLDATRADGSAARFVPDGANGYVIGTLPCPIGTVVCGLFGRSASAGVATIGVACRADKDFDECSEINNICGAHGSCTDTKDGYICNCSNGFEFNAISCIDIDECADNSTCNGHGLCVNTNGGYNCRCFQGWFFDNVTCVVDKCFIPGSCDGNGTASCSSGVCNCKQGYNGEDCSKDIDECAAENGYGGCHANATCTNTPGAHTCQCSPGFFGNGTVCTALPPPPRPPPPPPPPPRPPPTPPTPPDWTNRTWDMTPMPFVPDYEAYCEDPTNSGKPECFGWWCDSGLPDDVVETDECNFYFEYCARLENANSNLCTPPCDLLDDPESNPLCVDNSRRPPRP